MQAHLKPEKWNYTSIGGISEVIAGKEPTWELWQKRCRVSLRAVGSVCFHGTMASSTQRAFVRSGAAVLVVLFLTELLTWRASRESVAGGPPIGEGDIVVALGFRSTRDGQINFMQRWRTRIAVRSVSHSGLILFAGGSKRGRSEAAIMADYAIENGFPAERIRLEEQSRTTWENISNNLAVFEMATEIRFASNTFHARRARQYLAKQAPHLADRLRRGRDFVWFEYAPFKAYLVAYEFIESRIRTG